jgi:hypothetical protein
MLSDMEGFQADADDTFRYDVLQTINDKIEGEFDGSPMTFQVTTDWAGYYATKDESWDWYYGVGGYSYAYGAEVTVTQGADGQPQVEVNYQMHVFDRYNWDPGKVVTILGQTVADASLGELHQAGLAHEYEIRGTSEVQQMTYTYEGGMDVGTVPVPSGDR